MASNRRFIVLLLPTIEAASIEWLPSLLFCICIRFALQHESSSLDSIFRPLQFRVKVEITNKTLSTITLLNHYKNRYLVLSPTYRLLKKYLICPRDTHPILSNYLRPLSLNDYISINIYI